LLYDISRFLLSSQEQINRGVVTQADWAKFIRGYYYIILTTALGFWYFFHHELFYIFYSELHDFIFSWTCTPLLPFFELVVWSCNTTSIIVAGIEKQWSSGIVFPPLQGWIGSVDTRFKLFTQNVYMTIIFFHYISWRNRAIYF